MFPLSRARTSQTPSGVSSTDLLLSGALTLVRGGKSPKKPVTIAATTAKAPATIAAWTLAFVYHLCPINLFQWMLVILAEIEAIPFVECHQLAVTVDRATMCSDSSKLSRRPGRDKGLQWDWRVRMLLRLRCTLVAPTVAALEKPCEWRSWAILSVRPRLWQMSGALP